MAVWSNLVIRPCPACGTQNRIPAQHLVDTGHCGSCKAPLPPVDRPIEADPTLFDEIVGNARVPVLVDFWAAWCGPCQAAAPEVERTAENMAGRALVLKVDTEQHPDLAGRFRVSSIPNLVVLRDGQVVLQQAGLVGHARMEEWLRSAGA